MREKNLKIFFYSSHFDELKLIYEQARGQDVLVKGKIYLAVWHYYCLCAPAANTFY